MFKVQFMRAGAVALVMCANSVIAQEKPLKPFLEENRVAGENTESALECAALAFRFDNEEHARLLAFGYAQGQELMPALFAAMLGDEFEADVESIPWDETPYENMRELVAFQLGQMYGKFEERFFRDIPYGDSAETWEAAYRREYNSRNCALIGK